MIKGSIDIEKFFIGSSTYNLYRKCFSNSQRSTGHLGWGYGDFGMELVGDL
jgi:hypothetical protein